MAEITTIPKRSRPYQRPPLLSPIPPGATLYERMDLPRYEPPKPKPRPVFLDQKPQPANKIAQPAMPLTRLLTDNPGLPQQTAILGICDDHLPMLLDLNDPSPGSLLVAGDERQQQLDLLRTAISSIVLRNTPRSIQFIVFSHLPNAWQDWVNGHHFDRYCLGIIGVDSPDTNQWIQNLAEWTNQRQAGLRSGPPIIILLDTLNFIPKLNHHLRLCFEVIIKEGPRTKIWPIAAISTALASSLTRQVDQFQTLIYGYTEDISFYTRFSGISETEAKALREPGKFAVKLGSEENPEWLKFQLPILG